MECRGRESARCSTEELRAGGAGGGTNQEEWESEGPDTLQVAWWGHDTVHLSHLSMPHPVGVTTAV